jgi:hypothetical protein
LIPWAIGIFAELPRIRLAEDSGDFLGCQKAAYGVTGLRTASEPILDPFGIERNKCGALERIVCPHDLDGPSITGLSLIEHHNAIKRVFLLSNPSQANCQHD